MPVPSQWDALALADDRTRRNKQFALLRTSPVVGESAKVRNLSSKSRPKSLLIYLKVLKPQE